MQSHRLLPVLLMLIAPSPILAAPKTATVVVSDQHAALKAQVRRLLFKGPDFAKDPEYLALAAASAPGKTADPFQQRVLSHMEALRRAAAFPERDLKVRNGIIQRLADIAHDLDLTQAEAVQLLPKYLGETQAPSGTAAATGPGAAPSVANNESTVQLKNTAAAADENALRAAYDGSAAAKAAAAPAPVKAPQPGASKPAAQPVAPIGPKTLRDGAVPPLTPAAVQAQAEAAKLSAARFRTVKDPEGCFAGFEIEAIEGKVPDLVALQKGALPEMAFLKRFQALELQDLLRLHFPRGLRKGARVYLLVDMTHQDNQHKAIPMPKLVIESPGMVDMFLYQGDFSLLHQRRLQVGRGETDEYIQIYHGFTEQDRGGGQHWGRMEDYKPTYVTRYSVEQDWHTEKEFSYKDQNWDGKAWNVLTEKKPQDDTMWTWTTKRIGWTFENVHGYKEIGWTVGAVADRGKDFGYLISGYAGEAIGAKSTFGSAEHMVYGIITKWQAPGYHALVGGTTPGQKLIDELKASLSPEDFKNLSYMWREEYSKAQFAATGNMALAVAIKDERTDVTEEDLGRYLIGGGAGMGFGGAGAEFAKRASESKTVMGKVGNFTGAALVYTGDFTMQSLGFNAIGGIANYSANAARVATAGNGWKVANGLVQGARFTQDAYFTSLMGVQGLQVGDAISRGDNQAVVNSVAQVAGILLMPGGDHERMQKEGMFKVDFKASGKELLTSNMLAGAIGKAADVSRASKAKGFSGAAAELGFNPNMKSGKLYSGASELMADAARELGKTDPTAAKELAGTAANLQKASADQVKALADKTAANAAPGSVAAEAAKAMKAEAESKLVQEGQVKLYTKLKGAGFDAKTTQDIMDRAALPETQAPKRFNAALQDGAALAQVPELKRGSAEGEAIYPTAKGTPLKRPAKMAVEIRSGGLKLMKGEARKVYGEIVNGAKGFELKLKGVEKGQPGAWSAENGKWLFKTADGKFSLSLPGETPLFTGPMTESLRGALTVKELEGKKTAELANGVQVVELDAAKREVKTLFPEDWTAADVAEAQRQVLEKGKIVDFDKQTVIMRDEVDGVVVDVKVSREGKVEAVEPAPFVRNRYGAPAEAAPAVEAKAPGYGKSLAEKLKATARRLMGDKDRGRNGMAEKETGREEARKLDEKMEEVKEDKAKDDLAKREENESDELKAEEEPVRVEEAEARPLEEAKGPEFRSSRRGMIPRAPVAPPVPTVLLAQEIPPPVASVPPTDDDKRRRDLLTDDKHPRQDEGKPSVTGNPPSQPPAKTPVMTASAAAPSYGGGPGGGYAGGPSGGGNPGAGFGEGKGAGNIKDPFGGGGGGGGGGGSSSGSADGAGSSAGSDSEGSGSGGGAPGAQNPAASDGGQPQPRGGHRGAPAAASASAGESPATAEAPLQKLYDNNQKPVAEPGPRNRALKSQLPYDSVIPPSNLEARMPHMRPLEGPVEAPPARAARLPRRWSMPADAAPVQTRYEPQPWDPISYHFYDNDVPYPGPRPKDATNWDMAYIIILTLGGAAAGRLFVKNAMRPEKPAPSLRTQIAKI